MSALPSPRGRGWAKGQTMWPELSMLAVLLTAPSTTPQDSHIALLGDNFDSSILIRAVSPDTWLSYAQHHCPEPTSDMPLYPASQTACCQSTPTCLLNVISPGTRMSYAPHHSGDTLLRPTSGCWLLAAGFWLLAAGCCLLGMGWWGCAKRVQ